MIAESQVRDLVGSTAYGPNGEKLGKVGQVYFDERSNRPEWVTVHTGLFGTNETFVPVQGAEFSGDRVTLGYDKQKIKNAPNIAEDGHLSENEEQQLYRHYGLDYGTTATTGVSGGRDRDRDDDRDGDGVYDDVANTAVGRDTSGPTTDSAMTRSEEQLRVGTETRQAGKARLRKYVTTEHQQTTVPVSHEEVTLEREPITDANRGDAYDGPAISEEEHEVTLHAERPVVDTEAVPVERVRVGKQTITDQETVGGDVRKEQIEVDDTELRRR
jgi:uncharacterized protein (TIGR02271 family)